MFCFYALRLINVLYAVHICVLHAVKDHEYLKINIAIYSKTVPVRYPRDSELTFYMYSMCS